MRIEINDLNRTLLLDTGSKLSLCKDTPEIRSLGTVTVEPEAATAYTVGHHRIVLRDTISLHLPIGGEFIKNTFWLFPDLPFDFLLGWPDIQTHEIDIFSTSNTIRVGRSSRNVDIVMTEVDVPIYDPGAKIVTAEKSIKIPPHTSLTVPIRLPNTDDKVGRVLLEPIEVDSFSRTQKRVLQPHASLSSVLKPSILVSNHSNVSLTVPKGKNIATVSFIDVCVEPHVCNIDVFKENPYEQEPSETFPQSQTSKSSEDNIREIRKVLDDNLLQNSKLSSSEKARLKNLLTTFVSRPLVLDLDYDRPPVPGFEHSIELTTDKIPAVKFHRQSRANHQLTTEAVVQHEKDGVVRKISSPFAAPVVWVRKSDGSRRMCVDYTELNKIRLKTPTWMISLLP